MNKVVKEYIEHIQKAEAAGNKICQMLVNAIKPVIPDIRCTVRWVEGGVDSICLHTNRYVEPTKDSQWFTNILKEVEPELVNYIDCDILIRREEVEKIRESLRKTFKDEEIWNIKDKIRKAWITFDDPFEKDMVTWFEGKIVFEKDIETLRQKIMKDIEDISEDPVSKGMWGIAIQTVLLLLKDKINERFGVKEEGEDE